MRRVSHFRGDSFLYTKSYVVRNAESRRASPTRAEAELERVLNSLNGGVLKSRFRREHVVSGRWIVDFFFPSIRLAIEVDGSVHNTESQRVRDSQKEADCARFDITLLRLRNSDVFGSRAALVEKLRKGWAGAQARENKIIGTVSTSRGRREPL
jgi:very-short-patch-repair endonuclease